MRLVATRQAQAQAENAEFAVWEPLRVAGVFDKAFARCSRVRERSRFGNQASLATQKEQALVGVDAIRSGGFQSACSEVRRK